MIEDSEARPTFQLHITQNHELKTLAGLLIDCSFAARQHRISQFLPFCKEVEQVLVVENSQRKTMHTQQLHACWDLKL